MSVLEFTPEEWRRPHRHREPGELGGWRIWDAPSMQWDLYDADGKYIGVVCPDHERAAGSPAYEALLAKLRTP